MAGISEISMFFFALSVFIVLLYFPKQAILKRDLSMQEPEKLKRNSKSWVWGRTEERE